MPGVVLEIDGLAKLEMMGHGEKKEKKRKEASEFNSRVHDPFHSIRFHSICEFIHDSLHSQVCP